MGPTIGTLATARALAVSVHYHGSWSGHRHMAVETGNQVWVRDVGRCTAGRTSCRLSQ